MQPQTNEGPFHPTHSYNPRNRRGGRIMPAGEVVTETAKPATFTPRTHPRWTGPPLGAPPPPHFMHWQPQFYAGQPPFPFPPSPNTPQASTAASGKSPMNMPYQAQAFGHPPFVPPFPYFSGWQNFWGGRPPPPRRKSSRQNSAKIETPPPEKVVLALPAPPVEPTNSPPPPGELVPLACSSTPPSPAKSALTLPPTPPKSEHNSVPPSPTESTSASASAQPLSSNAVEIYRPPTVNWLLSGDAAPDQPRLSFDVRYSPSVNARITGASEARRLTTRATLSWAIAPMVTEMHLICPLLPWKVRVMNKRGVTVEDVLMRIAEELEIPMTDSERCIVSDELWQRALDARDRNIKEGTGHAERRKEGDDTVRRVDWLGENTMFRRISRGLDTEESTAFTHQRSHQKDRTVTWLLELGPR